jgi:hypothetical protein
MKTLVCFIALSMVFAGSASATHKSWVRYESGSSCIDLDIPQHVVNAEVTWNFTADAAEVFCPIRLGGSLQDPAHSIPQHTKVPSMRIQVFYYDGNDESLVYCHVAALTSTGRVLWTPGMESCSAEGGCVGGSVERSFRGVGRLDFADPRHIANRRIGVVDADTASDITEYGVECDYPPGRQWRHVAHHGHCDPNLPARLQCD